MEDFVNLKPHLHSCLFGPVTLNWTSNPQRTTPRPLPSNLRFILPHTELHGSRNLLKAQTRDYNSKFPFLSLNRNLIEKS